MSLLREVCCCEDILQSYMDCGIRSYHDPCRIQDDVKTWSKNLQSLLNSSYGRALFRAFLQKEYAEENLDFVLKVDIYRTCSPRKRAKMAWKLYRTFIAIGAPHELNLDILSRKVTDLAMITPHVSTFDTAQKRILNLLENDAYRRFLMWNVYLDLVHTYDVHQNPDEDDETRL
ncbi:regulator of G-protein signaling 4-like [Tigriopus californicus]|uniref:regulator of G-protein signaling 4-like n=1 Tax=Tigriopus californicus TaxID=6832 RepID=UPI0027DAA715|nr:regulator of G-protein signaling 4-like [Tigriopus californicus]